MLLNYEKLGSWRWALTGFAVVIAAYLLLPIFFVAALSFGSSRWMVFPPPGWTLQWYQALFADPRWLETMWNSLRVASLVTVLSVTIGLLASFGLTRGQFVGRETIKAIILMPLILPVVVLAVALYVFFLPLGLTGTLTGFVIAHLVVALPLSVLSITTALASFDTSIEDAAIICGASPTRAKFLVTLPAIRGGLFTAAVFSFLTSWDDVVLAIFMVSPGFQTLPVKIWSTLRADLTPAVAAASTMLVLLTLILMLVVRLFQGTRSSK